MQAMYLGGPSRKDGLSMFGVWFPQGEWVAVDPESTLAQKLPGHPHFSMREVDPEEEEKAVLRQILEDAGQKPNHRCSLETLRRMVEELNANEA